MQCITRRIKGGGICLVGIFMQGSLQYPAIVYFPVTIEFIQLLQLKGLVRDDTMKSDDLIIYDNNITRTRLFKLIVNV